MVALPPLKSTTSQVLDLAKEEQTRRLICEGGEVGMPSVAGSLSRHADNLFGGFNKKA